MIRTIALFSLLIAGACCLPVHADEINRAGAEKLGWKLTLQTWTIQKTVFDSIDVAEEIGVQFLEIYPGQPISADIKEGKFGPGMTDEQIKAVLDKAKEANVQIIDTGVIGIPSKEADARKFFDWIKKMGITLVVTEPDPKDLPMIDQLAGEYSVTIGIHDHPKPTRYWDPEFTWSVIKDLKHVGYTADVGHWKRSGLDPVEVLKAHGDRAVSSHFKDLVANDNAKGLHDVVWGTGDSKAIEMLAVLKEKGFKGPIAIEFEYKWDIPTLKKCVAFFHEQANKLAGT